MTCISVRKYFLMIYLSPCNYDSLVILLINAKEGFRHLIKGFRFQDTEAPVHSQRHRKPFSCGGNTSFDPPPLPFPLFCLLLIIYFFLVTSPLLPEPSTPSPLSFLFFQNTVAFCYSEILL